MTGHRFIEMRRIDADQPFTVGAVTFAPGVYWAGVCTCGEDQMPAPDKDVAWEEFADHFVQRVPELRAIAERNAVLRALGEQMSGPGAC